MPSPEFITGTLGRFRRKASSRIRSGASVGLGRASGLLPWPGLSQLSPFRPRPVLPPGATTQHLVVPAYWDLSQRFQPYWNQLQNSSGALTATVVEQSWPAAAINNPAFKSAAQALMTSLPGAVLGYVSTRKEVQVEVQGKVQVQRQLLQPDEILGDPAKGDSVQAWYDQFGQQIDGIYFDELVLPDDPGSVAVAQTLIGKFKAAHPTAKAGILAGQCIDEAVVGPNIDWTMLWETKYTAYHDNFTGMKGAINTQVPSWWKNPAYRQKILHVVHGCPEPNRQNALGLANERNAGLVFVMDERGINNQGNPSKYDHLPPYWDVEVREVNSYYDFGLDPERALRAAHRYGVAQGALTAWPNFEQAWYANHVRGTLFLAPGPHAVFRDVNLTDLVDPLATPQYDPLGLLQKHPPLYDIPAVWRAAHTYAQGQGFETAIPTFEQANYGNGPVYGLVLLTKGLPWLTATQVQLSATYEKPTFAEPGSVLRNVGRVAGAAPAKGAICTFIPDNPMQPRGRTNYFNCYVFGQGAPVTWQDVPTSTYIAQL